MASNIIQRTIPSWWNSANDDIIFEFDFTPQPIDSVVDSVSGSVSTGFAVINLQNEFDPIPAPGDKVYVSSGIYKGLHTISSVLGNSQITLTTTYIGGVVSNADNVYHLRVPTFNFYKGYKTGELFETALPFTLVTPIVPSVLFDDQGLPYLSINVRGLTMYLFSILSITLVENATPDYSMFNAIRFLWDDQTTQGVINQYVNVLNSAITTEDLNERYITRGYYLTPIDKPFVYDNGVTFLSKFDNNPYPEIEIINQ